MVSEPTWGWLQLTQPLEVSACAEQQVRNYDGVTALHCMDDPSLWFGIMRILDTFSRKR